ncbi:uncharacterized protein [Oscarella lobularis]|uniref:uncharacterized protein n=1 Tax=Oscarella lobularis TaxID=121494 RepID=UPI0033144D58
MTCLAVVFFMLFSFLSFACLASLSEASLVALTQEKEADILSSSDYDAYVSKFDVIVVVRAAEEDDWWHRKQSELIERDDTLILRDSLRQNFGDEIRRISNDADLLDGITQNGVYLLKWTGSLPDVSDIHSGKRIEALVNLTNKLEATGKRYAVLFAADSAERVKRRLLSDSATDAPPSPPKTAVFVKAVGDSDCSLEVALLYADSFTMQRNCSSGSGQCVSESQFSQMINGSLTCTTTSRVLAFTVPFNDTDNIEFRFNATNGTDDYWKVGRITFSTVNLLPNPVLSEDYINAIEGVPYNFSFHCGVSIIYSANTTNYTAAEYLEMKDLQIHMFGSKSERFGDNVDDCIGYFSTPLWSGILVVSLFLFIFIVSIYFMFSMQTMDRFDNPKGKTIIVATS